MLRYPTPGGQQPSEIVFGQAAEAGNERVPDDKQAESDDAQRF
jgi:hypothetical protein